MQHEGNTDDDGDMTLVVVMPAWSCLKRSGVQAHPAPARPSRTPDRVRVD